MTMMILLVIGLLLAGALVAIGLRGRVTQRGRFCRWCRFDLAGIDTDDPGARCTECGRPVNSPEARRSTLRIPRRWPIIAAAVILLLYGGVGAIVLSGSAPAVLARMPSGIVLASARWRNDAALDELMRRLGARPRRRTRTGRGPSSTRWRSRPTGRRHGTRAGARCWRWPGSATGSIPSR